MARRLLGRSRKDGRSSCRPEVQAFRVFLGMTAIGSTASHTCFPLVGNAFVCWGHHVRHRGRGSHDRRSVSPVPEADTRDAGAGRAGSP